MLTRDERERDGLRAAAAMLSASRILVVGSPGAGKTTVARGLARDLGLPLHHLDDLHWGAGWRRPDPGWWRRKQCELVAGERWIIDGNYLPTMHLRAARAQVVLLVDSGQLRCVGRLVRRAWRIRHGDHSSLPLAVQKQAAAGARVRATSDFARLIRMAALFRFRSWWRVVGQVRAVPSATLLVAVDRRRRAGSNSVLRPRLQARSGLALIVPLADLRRALTDLAAVAPADDRPAHQRPAHQRPARGPAAADRPAHLESASEGSH